jgi:hypothetical protein
LRGNMREVSAEKRGAHVIQTSGPADRARGTRSR